ncbi:MAG: hypothetical protein EOP62_22900 [Sphingomonadales bacterium]|nr:MAG: hypothetical protein EOP62_22900 [Sphingomonadales bacterium]
MTETKLGQLVGNTVAAVITLALLAMLGSCVFSAIGRGIDDARHPELAAQRKAQAAAEIVETQRKEQARIADEEARRAAHAQTMRDLSARARESENRCIQRMDYETCRRIYRPTREESIAQQAQAERAARIAEAYRQE